MALSFAKHLGSKAGFGGCLLKAGCADGLKLIGDRLCQRGPCCRTDHFKPHDQYSIQIWEKRAFQTASYSRLHQTDCGACMTLWASVALSFLWTLGQYRWGTIVPFGDLVPDASVKWSQVADYFKALQQAYHKSIFNDILLLGQNPVFLYKIKSKELMRVASDTRLFIFAWDCTTQNWGPLNISTYISSVLACYLKPLCCPARKHSLAKTGEIHKCCMGQVWLVYKLLIEPLQNSACCEQIASVGRVLPPSLLLFPCKEQLVQELRSVAVAVWPIALTNFVKSAWGLLYFIIISRVIHVWVVLFLQVTGQFSSKSQQSFYERIQMLTPDKTCRFGIYFNLIALIHLYKDFFLKKWPKSLALKGMLYMTQHGHTDLGSWSRAHWDQYGSVYWL